VHFCDHTCKYAAWPEEEALDGSGSCRTFQAVFCRKKGMLVHKNMPCPEKENRTEENFTDLQNSGSH
jgi:hypothetical protein